MIGVSVILTTYNGQTRGYLHQAIESIRSQTYKHLELIIIDDGSTDDTAGCCQKYLEDPRVSFFTQENKGPAAARNHGISRAKYRYIAFLDDDDFYEPQMIEKMHDTITSQKNQNVGMIYCRTRHINKEGVILKTPLFSGKLPIYEALFYGNVLSTPSLLIDKIVFDTVGTFHEHLRYAEDYELWFRISKQFKVHPLDELLVNIRVHDTQLSNDPKKMELFHSLVLHQAIETASPRLKSMSDSFLYLFYLSYMKLYLGMRYFKDFRRMLLSAKEYGPISLKWRCKYWISYFPKLFLSIDSIVRDA